MTQYEVLRQLRFYRLAKGYSVVEISEKMHISKYTYAHTETEMECSRKIFNIVSSFIGDTDWEAVCREKNLIRRNIMYRMREIRMRKGITLTWVADQIGVSLAAMWNYENGCSLPCRELAQKICRIYGINYEDFRGAHVLLTERKRGKKSA